MAALGTTAPAGSEMVPVMVPRSLCANAVRAHTNSAASERRIRIPFRRVANYPRSRRARPRAARCFSACAWKHIPGGGISQYPLQGSYTQPTGGDMRPHTIVILLVSALYGQQPAAAPAKPDSEAVKALIEKAKKAGGPMWAGEEHFFCEAPRANSPNDPPIEPTRIFDNVYVIGNQGTVAYVISTSAGLLMIDSLSADQVQTQLLPGFQKLGLDPANVKVIVMGHGHADHFGGSPYMQEHYGSRIYRPAERRAGRGCMAGCSP